MRQVSRQIVERLVSHYTASARQCTSEIFNSAQNSGAPFSTYTGSNFQQSVHTWQNLVTKQFHSTPNRAHGCHGHTSHTPTAYLRNNFNHQVFGSESKSAKSAFTQRSHTGRQSLRLGHGLHSRQMSTKAFQSVHQRVGNLGQLHRGKNQLKGFHTSAKTQAPIIPVAALYAFLKLWMTKPAGFLLRALTLKNIMGLARTTKMLRSVFYSYHLLSISYCIPLPAIFESPPYPCKTSAESHKTEEKWNTETAPSAIKEFHRDS